MIKNILIIGNREKNSLENFYYKAFKKLNIKTTFFKIEKTIKNRIYAKLLNIYPNINYVFLRSKIYNFINNSKKDFDLIIIFKGLYLNKKLLRNLKTKYKNALIINIFPDDPFRLKNKNISNIDFFKTINEFDVFCIWSIKLKKKLEKKFKNVKIIYLPFAYDNLHNFNFTFKHKNTFDKILFIGTYDKHRYKILNSIKYDKYVCGGNWNKLFIYNKNKTFHKHVHGRKLLKLIISSKISLNILREQNLTSHNMKTFEITGNKGLLLTTRSYEQDLFFKENKESFMYSNIKELNKKIDFIMKNPKVANKIRTQGYLKAKKHTYFNRAKYIISLIKKIKYKRFAL